MSQYPSPYSLPPVGQPTPQTYPYAPVNDPRLPARRAGLLMIILGSLAILLGICAGSMALVLPSMLEQMPPAQREQLEKIEEQGHASLATQLLANTVVMFLIGVPCVVLGIFTRGGGRGIVITSIVFTGLCILLTAAGALFALAMPGAICNLFIAVVILALQVLLMVWLIQAAGAAGKIAMMQQQYAAQYMQYQQMMQQYGQAGYGQAGQAQYGYPQAPQAPAPPPQTDQSNPPPPQQ